MKRAFLLVTLLLVVCACSSAIAIQYGDYAYRIANGQATIVGCSGYGGGPDWDYLDEEEGNPERPGKWDESACFPHFIDGVWRMVIPDTLEGYPVVAIGDGAFCEAERFHDAIIPEGVVSIGDQAFSHCYALGALTIPASVTSIGGDLFAGIEGFGYTVLRVTEGSYAAQYARENEIPYTYDAQFRFIESGEWLYALADDTATIYGFVGNCDDDGNVTIPDHLDGYPVTAIEHGVWIYAFCRNGLTMTSVTIPQSVASIGDKVFSECTALSSVIFPQAVTSIGNYVFDGCESLTSVAIPASCTSIGERAFANCPNLILTVEEGSYAEQYAEENGIPYIILDESIADAGGQWKYVLEDGGATITGFVEEPSGGLVIPSEVDGYPVTRVRYEAFSYCEEITSVIIPEGVTEIGAFAFGVCGNMLSVILPDSLTVIGDNAFTDCSALTSVTIPDGVTSIGIGVFWGCSSLTVVTIPDSVASIGADAFEACASLTSVTIPAGVKHIEGNPFIGCPLTEIRVSPDNPAFAQIGGVLFDKQGKTLIAYPIARAGDYVIPQGVTHIGDYAFYECTSLTGVTIPEGVTEIGELAFGECGNILSVILPDSVTGIGDSAFAACTCLTSVTVPGSVDRIGDAAFAVCKGLTDVTITDGVTVIGDYAFYFCSGLTSVMIPGSVARIEDDAFWGCETLTLLVPEGSYTEQYAKENGIPYMFTGELILRGVIPGSYAAQYARKNEIPFLFAGYMLDAGRQFVYILEDGSAVLTIYWKKPVGDIVIPGELDGYPVTSIGDEAFSNCKDLTGVTIPEGVTEIDDFAFADCDNMHSVTLPDSVTSIGEYAFADCYSLTSVNIPAGVTNIVGNPFMGCPLTDIGVSPDNPAFVQIGGVLFDKQGKTVIIYPKARVGEYAIPEGVTHIGDMAFWQCEGLTAVIIPDGVTGIGSNSFAKCGLTGVIFPDSVISIGNGAFYGCTDLASVTIPSSVKSIGYMAFNECGNLSSVTLPASITEIGEGAFEDCDGLTLSVTEGSYAEQYAKENDIPYVFTIE